MAKQKTRPRPLKVDPTRSKTEREKFAREANRRFLEIAVAIKRLIVDSDVFGLSIEKPKLQLFNTSFMLLNTRWQFLSTPDKISAFKKWLKEQMDAGLLTKVNGVSWTDTYIESGYKKGLVRSFTDVRKEELAKEAGFYQGSKEQFLMDSFTAGPSQQRLQLLYTRTWEQLEGITEAMGRNISRVLTDGLSHGRGPLEIARELNKQVGISRNRAKTLARTEIIHAHAEGQLDGMEMLGIEEVGVMVEWITAGDEKVCPQCEALEGVVLKVDEARGLLPRHPNCRCAFLPANVGESTKNQIRDPKKIKSAFKRSVRKESPKKPVEKALKDSRWGGADLKISGRRPKIFAVEED